MADDFAELTLGHQQSRADPTLDVIAVAPAFDVSANGFDDGKGRLDHIGAAQGTAESSGTRASLQWGRDQLIAELAVAPTILLSMICDRVSERL